MQIVSISLYKMFQFVLFASIFSHETAFLPQISFKKSKKGENPERPYVRKVKEKSFRTSVSSMFLRQILQDFDAFCASAERLLSGNKELESTYLIDIHIFI